MSKFQQMPVPPYPGERDPGKESLVKVAALQMEPHIGDKDYNMAETLKIIDKAGKMGAKLMVLPVPKETSVQNPKVPAPQVQ